MTDLDFTEVEYASLVELAHDRYRFIAYDELAAEPPVVLWRHDVDFSPQRAAALARIEAERGLRATYFFNLHSDFYNVLEEEPSQCVRAILALGHALGVHFDPSAVSALPGTVDDWLHRERALLEAFFETGIRAFSLHNPERAGGDRRNEVAGLINTYGSQLETFTYCSDSNGVWRHERLRDVLESGGHDRLHVLTHPGWWCPEPMTPRDRISRAIDGRAAATHSRYDRLLAAAGRPNVR
jgi:hypothetical protein